MDLVVADAVKPNPVLPTSSPRDEVVLVRARAGDHLPPAERTGPKAPADVDVAHERSQGESGECATSLGVGRASLCLCTGSLRRADFCRSHPQTSREADSGSRNLHAACPSTRSPSTVAVGVGRQPDRHRCSRSSSALGRWPQTATAVTPPSQVVSYTKCRPCSSSTTTSWVSSSCTTTSTTRSPARTTSSRVPWDATRVWSASKSGSGSSI